jgi:FMN phosphatase YigB (HAD superfamily)
MLGIRHGGNVRIVDLKDVSRFMTIVTLDVFETVLTRRAAEGLSLALFVAEEISENHKLNLVPAEFKASRDLAERRARLIAPGAEPTLADIYRQWAMDSGHSHELGEALARLELVWEERLLCIVPGIDPLLSRLRRAHGSLVYVSDIHLPGKWLELQLRRHGLFIDGDRLYVSCEHGASKTRDGELFPVVMKLEGRQPREVVHYGNNGHADYRMAMKRGLKAVHLPLANLNRYERALEADSTETLGWSSLLAGASRLARVECCALAPKASEVQLALACSAAAPIQISYVCWLLRTAQEKGIRRLYFLARDGYPLWKCAEKLVAPMAPGMELRYLHVSRAALFDPLEEDGDSVRDRLFWPLPKPPTLRTIAGRLQMDLSELVALLPPDLARKAGSHIALEPESLHAIWSEIRSPTPLNRYLAAKTREKRALALRYFQEQGLMEALPSAVVDVGWNGSQKRSIDNLLDSVGAARPDLFLFACRPGPGIRDRLDQVHSFTGYDKPDWWSNGVDLLIETFCTVMEGSTIGYQVAGGCVIPLKADGQEEAQKAWGMEGVLEAVLLTTERFAEALHLVPRAKYPKAMPEVAVRVLRLFATTPRHEEVLAWGTFPYDVGMGDDIPSPLAPLLQINLKNLVAAAGGEFPWKIQLSRELCWKEGSIVRARHESKAFRVCEWLGRRVTRPLYFWLKKQLGWRARSRKPID